MAKRKRLSGPNPDFAGEMPPLETKSMMGAPVGKVPDHVLRTRRSAPIADVAAEASATAALNELTETMRRAREEGRVVLQLPLAAIQLDYLVRDRIAADGDEMQALVASLRERGQQMPVEVTDLGNGRYGLISGWRRCQALARLAGETGEARFDSVLALVRRPAEASEAYLAMVEENEIRVGLSYYERARIVARAVEQGVFETEKQALGTLFQAASRAKRSKIGTFLPIVRALDGALRFPAAIPERAGLVLGRALQDDAGLGARLRDALTRAAPASAEAEAACLQAGLGPTAPVPPAPSVGPGAQPTGGKPSAAPAPSAAPTRPAAPPEEPLPGLVLTSRPDGSLTLSGPGLDDRLRADLIAWLRARAAG